MISLHLKTFFAINTATATSLIYILICGTFCDILFSISLLFLHIWYISGPLPYGVSESSHLIKFWLQSSFAFQSFLCGLSVNKVVWPRRLYIWVHGVRSQRYFLRNTSETDYRNASRACVLIPLTTNRLTDLLTDWLTDWYSEPNLPVNLSSLTLRKFLSFHFWEFHPLLFKSWVEANISGWV